MVAWYIWCSVLAVASAVIGGHWDISWHRSIGRDTFWTPAHMAIYLCGVLSGISSAFLILSTTFMNHSPAQQTSVGVWRFRGPLGAFIGAWGGIAMLVSAPFDDWWHNAYGLDVKILSPPHTVLALGLVSVALGALILILGQMNRAEGGLREKLEWLFLLVFGMILVFTITMGMEYTFRLFMHTGRFYRVVSMIVPIVLTTAARASRRRWASTTVAAVYTVFMLGFQWILPLFPAEPKLGPVYQKVTHFIPPEFPMLLIVPAFVLDLIWMKTAAWRKWQQSVLAGAGFLTTLVAVQWPFANFLMSPGARNWFFGTHYFDYNVRPTSYYYRYLFLPVEKTAREFWTEMGGALFAAVVTTRLGLAWGNWMRRIQR